MCYFTVVELESLPFAMRDNPTGKEKKKKKERKYFDICFRESCALFCGRVCRLQIQFGGSTIQSDSEKFNFSVKKKRNRKD